MEQHRSIQDIIPPARSKPIRSPMPGTSETPPPSRPTPPPSMPVNPKRPSGFFGFAVVAGIVAVLLVVGVIVISTVFYRAYITVTPFSFSIPVQGSFAASLSSESLPYQKVSVSDTATKSVPATGTQNVENHSSGTITVYNAYTTTEQRLITNTRFMSPDGLIFRVHAPVVIPGYTMKAGIKVPGSVDVVVYADEAGDKYNIAASDFTIPGLKGSNQYTLIYAKSKSAMTGGFIGEQAVVDPSVRSETIQTLKADLERSLRAKIGDALPVGAIVFNDSISITYTEAPDTAEGNNAVISVSGTATAPAVNENALALALAGTGQVSYQGILRLDSQNDLRVTVDAPENIGTETPINLAISGTARLVAAYDTEKLAEDLAGISKKDIQAVLPNYPAISNIDVKIYPFWRGGLPADPSKLKISEEVSSTN